MNLVYDHVAEVAKSRKVRAHVGGRRIFKENDGEKADRISKVRMRPIPVMARKKRVQCD